MNVDFNEVLNNIFESAFTPTGSGGGDDPIGQLDSFPDNIECILLTNHLNATNVNQESSKVSFDTINSDNKNVCLFIETCDLGDGLNVYVFLTLLSN